AAASPLRARRRGAPASAPRLGRGRRPRSPARAYPSAGGAATVVVVGRASVVGSGSVVVGAGSVVVGGTKVVRCRPPARQPPAPRGGGAGGPPGTPPRRGRRGGSAGRAGSAQG